MAHSFPSTHLIAALRSILQELETEPEAQAHRPELENLKRQILLTLADLENRQQLASPPAPKAAVAMLAELLRDGGTALAAQPDALPALTTKDPG